VTLQIIVGGKSLVAYIAPNTAQVFGYVSRERALVGQHFIAHSASGVARVNLEVRVAAPSRAVRLLAHTANKPPVTLDYLIGRQLSPGGPSWNGPGQGIACKH